MMLGGVDIPAGFGLSQASAAVTFDCMSVPPGSAPDAATGIEKKAMMIDIRRKCIGRSKPRHAFR
jgi:hypothetical protein